MRHQRAAAMRHAGAVTNLTGLEFALIPAAAALAGVALGIVGNEYLDRQRDRRAAKQQRDQAIAELLTATVDLLSGTQALRAAYMKQGRWRHYIRLSAVIMIAMGAVIGPGGELSTEILRDWHRMAPGLDRILTADRELDEKQRTTVLDMVTVVLPRTVRFYAAVAVLTLGPDKKIADAVRDLTPAVTALVGVIAARSGSISVPAIAPGTLSPRSAPSQTSAANCAHRACTGKSRGRGGTSVATAPTPRMECEDMSESVARTYIGYATQAMKEPGASFSTADRVLIYASLAQAEATLEMVSLLRNGLRMPGGEELTRAVEQLASRVPGPLTGC